MSVTELERILGDTIYKYFTIAELIGMIVSIIRSAALTQPPPTQMLPVGRALGGTLNSNRRFPLLTRSRVEPLRQRLPAAG